MSPGWLLVLGDGDGMTSQLLLLLWCFPGCSLCLCLLLVQPSYSLFFKACCKLSGKKREKE
jgi:hypothetical protein